LISLSSQAATGARHTGAPVFIPPLPTDRLPRIVFDTNVLLSLFVFADSRFTPLRTEIDTGRWLALSNARCLGEFRRVLAYPMFKLEPEQQEAALAAYVARATMVDATPAEDAVTLPKCRDKDDQKFLELARDGHADWLVSADKALLKMARRDKLKGLFYILTPDKALARLVGAAEDAGIP
jgi:putative PIN family toxin of toxin-antitoxin system